jgi:hypothetical protein
MTRTQPRVSKSAHYLATECHWRELVKLRIRREKVAQAIAEDKQKGGSLRLPPFSATVVQVTVVPGSQRQPRQPERTE